ncbi:hypothetical protein Hanom_Chr14g01320191 [Helianthus anomalus]
MLIGTDAIFLFFVFLLFNLLLSRFSNLKKLSCLLDTSTCTKITSASSSSSPIF